MSAFQNTSENHGLNPSLHVTAVITNRVKSGREQGYEEWMKGISAAARTFSGHLGVSILRPQAGSHSNYVVVLQFDSCAHLNDWLNSEVRQTWLERATPLIQEQEMVQVLSGLESWFELPKQQHPVPKRYKQSILVWTGVVSVLVFISPLIAPLLAPLPELLRIAINTAIVVVLLSYVIMPRLTKWFQNWLFT